MKQVIRIIGGLYRGKKIHFPDVDGLRPTPDRVRETLFNWLMNDIRNARCLDAFAGSGALGFEAYSRGASHVVFIEQSPKAHASLQNTIRQFDTPNLHLIKT
ncbi:TPA: 16S rRNA (guanine(966)-N(2))-methyltransferase RsmD, partial [Legionella pneumophila]|nr:16S rRNA (guanine(966)-N(2))-methyltransferase RsmD [Legionella pneumophila]